MRINPRANKALKEGNCPVLEGRIRQTKSSPTLSHRLVQFSRGSVLRLGVKLTYTVGPTMSADKS